MGVNGVRTTASARPPGGSCQENFWGPAAAGPDCSASSWAAAGWAPVFVATTVAQTRKFSPSVGQSNARRQSFTVGKGVAQNWKS